MSWRYFIAATALILLSLAPSVRAAAPVWEENGTPSSFTPWLQDFSIRAKEKGIHQQTLDAAFEALTPDAEVIRLDRKQPEHTITQAQYLKNTVTAARIAKGQTLMRTHAPLLKRISSQYQVPPEVIIALFGIETDYGANRGKRSVIRSLATLAMEGRRAAFFESELITALHLMQTHPDLIPLEGSWAGAMGNCQFMPSSYSKYATDGDGDGRADIWNSLPDSFASIAHYLHQEGWNPALGLGDNLPNNRPILLKWNRSSYFVKAVGLLSEKIRV